MDKTYIKELEGLKNGLNEEINIYLLKTTLKNIQLTIMEYMVSGQEVHLHSRQIITRDKQMSTRSSGIRMDDQRNDHIDRKGRKQRNHAKQLQTHNVPTDDVENINSTNKERDLLLINMPQIVS